MVAESPFKKLSVIIPCFNEEGNIPRIENELIQLLERELSLPEFLFIDDGSSDGSMPLLENVQRKYSSVKIIKHETNKGLGAAIRTGLDHCSGDAILVLDADLTFHPKDFFILRDAYDSDIHCVLGSPVLGQFQSVSLFRRFLSRGVNIFYQILLGQKITSTSSIFRLYRSDAIKKLKLECRSFDINAEILAKMILNGYRVKEVPVTLGVRGWGESKINVLREIKNHLVMFMRILSWKIDPSKINFK